MKILLLVYAVVMCIYGLYMFIPAFMDEEGRNELEEQRKRLIGLKVNPICAYILVGLILAFSFILISIAWPYSLIIDIKNYFRIKKLNKLTKFYKELNEKLGAQ